MNSLRCLFSVGKITNFNEPSQKALLTGNLKAANNEESNEALIKAIEHKMFTFPSEKATSKDFTNCVDYVDSIVGILRDSGYLEQAGYDLIHNWYVENKDAIRQTTNPFLEKFCGITLGKRDGVEQLYTRAPCLQRKGAQSNAAGGRTPSGQRVKGGKREALSKKGRSKTTSRKPLVAKTHKPGLKRRVARRQRKL